MHLIMIGERCPPHRIPNESNYFIMIMHSHKLNSPRSGHYLGSHRKNRQTVIAGLLPGKKLRGHSEGNDMHKVSAKEETYINQIKGSQTNRVNSVCPFDERSRFQLSGGNTDTIALNATNLPPGSRSGSKPILPITRN